MDQKTRQGYFEKDFKTVQEDIKKVSLQRQYEQLEGLEDTRKDKSKIASKIVQGTTSRAQLVWDAKARRR